MQQLMTEEIAKTVPRLYEQDGAEDPTVYAHYFSCVNGWDWWLLEFDGTDEAFGLVEGYDDELGYFSIKEMAELNRQMGFAAVEREERAARRERLGVTEPEKPASQVGNRRYARGRAYARDHYAADQAAAPETEQAPAAEVPEGKQESTE